jgi:electron transport complex protein RnfC
MPAPPTLYIPSDALETDASPPWLPAGTYVAAGDLLIDAGVGSDEWLIAPVAGTVGAPMVVRLSDGRIVHALELHPESTVSDPSPHAATDDPAAVEQLLAAATAADLAEWAEKLAALGVQANRWTSPDLLGQLRDATTKKVDSLICNLLDSDPWLGLNRGLATAEPLDLAIGIGLLTKLTGTERTWAMIDQAEPATTFDPLRAAAASVARQLRLAPIENDYPQPDPTLLVYAVTRRRLKPGTLPTEQKVLLLDGAAAVAIGRAARLALPVSRIPVVVYDQPGDAVHRLAVVPGTTLGAILEHLNIPIAVREAYAGSPLRQRRGFAGDVIGASGELTCFIAPPQPTVVAAPCIRCGWCIEGCPTQCRPAGLLEAAQRADLDLARRNGLDACIECGLCTYVCPSRLPILQGIRTLR